MTQEKNKIIVTDEKVPKEKYLTLRVFCIALELIGWLLIACGVVWFVRSIESDIDLEKNLEKAISLVSLYSFDFIFIGLVSIILARLSRFTADRSFHKSLLLCCGPKIVYLFAVFTLVWTAFRWRIYKNTIEDINWQTVLIQSLFLPAVAKFLILICLAQILKRILPVIEEYKSLV